VKMQRKKREGKEGEKCLARDPRPKDGECALFASVLEAGK